MIYEIEVQLDYNPKATCFYRKDREKWVVEYNLPASDKIRMALYLSKGTSEKKAKNILRLKTTDLLRGQLTQKEYNKYMARVDKRSLTIDDALKEYMEVTFIGKSPKNRENERSILPKRFAFFKEKFSINYIHQIKDSHIIDYKNTLIKMISKGEIAPSTSLGHFATVRKVFNWLKDNKKININPVADIKQIRINNEEKTRSITFGQEEIKKVMQTPFFSQNGFEMKAFFLWLRETGCRVGEAFHLEWNDIQDGIWYIKYKPKCPTKYGMGWKPKWGKEREVYLSPTALEILEYLPRHQTVGYTSSDSTPHLANFVFAVRDYNEQNPGGWRRVDNIKKTWKSLLKAAGLPHSGPDCFVRHDLRRTWNVEAKQFRGLNDEMRSQQLGNSVNVNNSNYAGQVDSEILKLRAKLQSSEGTNLLKFIRPLQKKVASTVI
ncbi:MAG: tyrosine-type recombinase/integrase [Bacteriovoracaceae bacterium]|nr:tyrosine-type recombinase/integrase [Bacteriovoracaceae bacterium]